MRTSTRVEDKVEILFGEAADRCALAVDEATQGADGDAAAEGDENDSHKWQDALQQVQEAVMEEFKAARIYPHVHARYQQDAHAQSFVPRLRDGSLTQARACPARWVAGRQERCARRGRASREW